MKTIQYSLIAFLSFMLILGSCHKNTQDEFTICATRCSASAPWVVESLDLGNPCFSNRDSCLKWASTHGYGGKPCVDCSR